MRGEASLSVGQGARADQGDVAALSGTPIPANRGAPWRLGEDISYSSFPVLHPSSVLPLAKLGILLSLQPIHSTSCPVTDSAMGENKNIAVEQRESAPVDSQSASAKEVEG